jgi:hypothetical protein
MTKEYWVTDNRFRWISLLLFLMFLIFMTFLYLKADEITHTPCQVCARQQGEDVVCTIGGLEPQTRTYHPNYSVSEGGGGR